MKSTNYESRQKVIFSSLFIFFLLDPNIFSSSLFSKSLSFIVPMWETKFQALENWAPLITDRKLRLKFILKYLYVYELNVKLFRTIAFTLTKASIIYC
jgi:hypothetical protein